LYFNFSAFVHSAQRFALQCLCYLFTFHSFVNRWSGEFVQLFSFTTPHPTPCTPPSQLAFAALWFASLLIADLQDGSWIREEKMSASLRDTDEPITWCFVLSSF